MRRGLIDDNEEAGEEDVSKEKLKWSTSWKRGRNVKGEACRDGGRELTWRGEVVF